MIISSFPYTDTNTTRSSGGTDIFNYYSCSPSTNESGREKTYRFTVGGSGTLTASLACDQSVDIDVHLLQSLSASDCLARAHISFTQWIAAGTYYIVCDTYVDGSNVELMGDYTLTCQFTPDTLPTATPAPPTPTPAPPTGTPIPPTNTPLPPTPTPTLPPNIYWSMANTCEPFSTSFLDYCDPSSMGIITCDCPTNLCGRNAVGWDWGTNDTGLVWQYFITPAVQLNCIKDIFFNMCYGFDDYPDSNRADFHVYIRCADGGDLTCGNVEDPSWTHVWSDETLWSGDICSSRSVWNQPVSVPCDWNSIQMMIGVYFDAYGDAMGIGVFDIGYDAAGTACGCSTRPVCPACTFTPVPTNTPIPSHTPVPTTPPTATPIPPTPTPSCLHTGDVNDDGEVTAGDAQIAFWIGLGTYSPTYAEACAADCDGNDEITAGDAQMIFFKGLGIGSCVD
ncbi:dockerin type I repeat-containing protein [bacterium]|nr:dockerin type I repeat-containing protein [candidate division CSSED10-310 bacterium]